MKETQAKEAISVKSAKASDESKVVDAIVLAFSADPCLRWMYPDPHQFLIHFPDFVRAFGGKAFQQETAYYADGFSGAALWLPPDVQPDQDLLVPFLHHTVSEKRQKTIYSVLEQMGSYHPKEPHWHLPLIGVDPARQRNGIGSVLMRHGLIPCDRDHTLAYLEATNPENISLYERHGFEVIGTIQVGDSPPLTPMLRKPQAV